MKKQIILMIVTFQLLLGGDLYRGAELRTLQSYKYGRFEVNYKAAGGSGITSTFFTYYDGTDTYKRWNELDIEIMGRYVQDIQYNAITPGQVNHVSHFQLNFDPYNEFHTYAIEWTPDYVAWFVDGSLAHKQTASHIQTLLESQKIMMNIWQPAYPEWAGDFDERQLPLFAEYDWVQYASYTPGSGNSGTDNNFTLQWHDDFNAFDAGRWAKASHTWGGNNCLFTPDNIQYRDGKMILCLTNANNTGYQDHAAPAVLWAKSMENWVQICYSEPVDSATATNTTSYLISGTTVLNAKYGSDRRIIELELSQAVDFSDVSIIVIGIKDTSPGNNTLMAQVVNVTPLLTFTFPLKINVGGNVSGEYIAGAVFAHSVGHGAEEGSNGYFAGQTIAGTDEDEIFRSERNGLTAYKIYLPNGSYDVTLFFAENYFTSAGKRQFDVMMEGRNVFDDLDVFIEAGGAHIALYKTISPVTVQDHCLDIWFTDIQKDRALLNGIIISAHLNSITPSAIPSGFRIDRIYPNPFNNETSIEYNLAQPSAVTMDIYDARGRLVDTLYQGKMNSGSHSVQWSAKFPSGIYFLRLSSSQNALTDTKKLILLQ